MLRDMLEIVAIFPLGVAIVALMLGACWAIGKAAGDE